jgi:PAS domain S-box-containing protein
MRQSAPRARSGQPLSQGWPQRVLEAAPYPIITMNAAGRIVGWNLAAHRLYGYSVAEAVGRDLSLLASPEHLDEVLDLVRGAAGGAGAELETEFVQKNGRRLSVSLAANPVRESGGVLVGVVAVARDNTEPKRIEGALRESWNQLQALSRRLVEVHETERTVLARELHDQIGQTLSAVKVNLEAIHRDVRDSAVLTRVEEGIAAVERAVELVQTLSFDLRPSLLDDLGLAAAVNAYTRRRIAPVGLSLGLAIAVDEAVPKEVEVTCFRIVQEAVTNVVSHARAKRLDVELRSDGAWLRLVVRDDGVGFPVHTLLAAAPAERQLGLLGMRERVQYVGGELEIESRPGAGTLVCARFPLRMGDAPEG